MARPGYAIGAGAGRVKSLIIPIVHAGPLVAFAAHSIKLTMPESGVPVGVTLNVGGRGGTHSTSTVDVQDDGVSTLATVLDVAALTPGTPIKREGTGLVGAVIAKDSVLGVVTVEAAGSSPTWQNAYLQLDYVPVGD